MWTIQIIDSYLTQAVNRLPRHTHLGEPTSPPPRRHLGEHHTATDIGEHLIAGTLRPGTNSQPPYYTIS